MKISLFLLKIFSACSVFFVNIKSFKTLSKILSILSIFEGYMSSIFTIKEVSLPMSTKSLTKSLFWVKENEIILLKVGSSWLLLFIIIFLLINLRLFWSANSVIENPSSICWSRLDFNSLK